MNYQSIYDQLIEKYGTWKKPNGVYTERHRKLPGYLGGRYVFGNAFYVPARVHYLCHILWAKITGHGKAWFAVKQIGAKAGRQKSRMYQKAKIIQANNARELFTGENNPAKRPEVRVKMSAAQKVNPVFLGKKRPAHSAAMMGENNPAYGKSNHAYGLVAHARRTVGKTLEEIHGEEKGATIRNSFRKAKAGYVPTSCLDEYTCHICGKRIRCMGNISQHLKKVHGLVFKNLRSQFYERK